MRYVKEAEKDLTFQEKMFAVKLNLRYKFAYAWRIISDMNSTELVICTISVLLFFFFLFSNRFLQFFINVRHTISGEGDPGVLLLDGILIIMMLIALYLMIQHVASFDLIEPQKNNHEAIKEVILPSYIRNSYKPIDEKLKILEDETNIVSEVGEKNSVIGDLLVGDPSLLDDISELFNYTLKSESNGDQEVLALNIKQEEEKQRAATRELAAGLAGILVQDGPLPEGMDTEALSPDLVYEVAKALDLIEEKPINNADKKGNGDHPNAKQTDPGSVEGNDTK